MVYPILPLYLTSTLGIEPAIVGLVEGLSKSITGIVKFYSGYFSDKKSSRKYLIIIGYFGTLLHKILLFFSNNWIWILISKVIERLGKSIRLAPRDAMISESGLEKGKVFGIQRTFDKLGAVIGIIISYFLITKLDDIDYKQIFLIAIIPSFIVVIILFFLKQDSDRKLINIDLSKFSKKIQLFFIIIFISSLGNSTKSFLLLKAADNGFDSSNVILLYLLANITTCILAYFIGKLCDKASKKLIISISYLLFGFIYLLFGLTGNHIIITILFILYGVYIALISISVKTFIVTNVPDDMKATALGINECLIGFASLPATIIAGLLWSTLGSDMSFYFSAIIGFISSILMYFV
jgi:MFS family permease